MDFRSLEKRLYSDPARAVGAGASRAEIANAEHMLGIKLRGDYRAFLESFGWGGAGDVEVFGLGADVPHHLNLEALTLSERTEANPRLPRLLIPLASDGAGNLFCLDTTEEQEGLQPVVLWDHERDIDQQPEQVADNFVIWLSDRLWSRGDGGTA